MIDEYRVFLQNLSFSYFSRLMAVARRMYESVKRTPKSSLAGLSNSMVRQFIRKRSIVAAIGKGQEVRPLKKKPSYRQEKKKYLVLHHFNVV